MPDRHSIFQNWADYCSVKIKKLVLWGDVFLVLVLVLEYMFEVLVLVLEAWVLVDMCSYT